MSLAIGYSQPTTVQAADNTISTSVSGPQPWLSDNLTITNQGIISGGSTGVTVASTSSVGTLTNSGKIGGYYTGVSNQGTVGAVTNNGVISGSTTNGVNNGVNNSGAIGVLTNTGTITSGISGYGVYNDGTLATLINAAGATINAGSTGFGLYNDTIGQLQTVANSGTIQAGRFGVFNQGSISSLNNGGLISATGTLGIGIFNAGSITSLSNASGSTITGIQTGIDNVASGSIASVTNGGLISGTGSSGTGFNNAGQIGAITNAQQGIISGYYTGLSNGGSIGSLTNSGTISGAFAGIVNESSGSIGTLTNSGTIATTTTVETVGTVVSTITNGIGVYNGGSLATLSNLTGGLIQATGAAAIAVSNDGNIGTLANSGSISGTADAVVNGTGGSIGSLVNSGLITGSGTVGVAIGNSGSISTLTNQAGGTISGVFDVLNSGVIGTIANSGAINGTDYAVINGSAGSIGSLVNNGTITGTIGAIVNFGSVTALVNSGLITGSGSTGIAVANTGSVGTLVNQAGGTISGSEYAILNSGNVSYTISGVTSISSGGGTIGVIANSGVIAGNIENDSTSALTIAGASGSSYGTLTGYTSGSAGTITSTNANVVFSSGNILLNDRINVGSYSVVNSGATLQLTSASTITGNYTQTGGGLVVVTSGGGTTYNALVVKGNASVTGSTITISGNGLTNGETFVVVNPTGTGSYSNDTVTIAGTGGLIGSATSVGNELVVALNHINYTAIGNQTGPVGSSMGGFLDTVASSTSAAAVAFQNTELAYIYSLPTAQQAKAIKQLAPIQLTPSSVVTATAVNPTTSAIETHQLALNERGETGAAAGSSAHDYALWGQVLGGTATRSTSATTDGFRSHDFGLMTGFDYLGDRDVTVGAALSWVRGWSWGSGDSTGNYAAVDSYQVTGYGERRWEEAFVDGQLGMGYTTTNQRRIFNLGQQAAHAEYDGKLYLAKLGAGYDVPVESVTVTPLIGWRFLRVISGGYRETGSVSNWTVAEHGVQSWSQDLGGKVSWNVETPWGGLTPEMRLAWIHDYTQGSILTYATLGNGLDAPPTPTARTAADGVRLNLAATLEEVGDVKLRLEYEGEIRPNYQSHSGLLKASLGF